MCLVVTSLRYMMHNDLHGFSLSLAIHFPAIRRANSRQHESSSPSTTMYMYSRMKQTNERVRYSAVSTLIEQSRTPCRDTDECLEGLTWSVMLLRAKRHDSNIDPFKMRLRISSDQVAYNY